MKIIKYGWALGLIALMTMALTACGEDPEPTATPTAPPAQATPTAMMADPTPTAMMADPTPTAMMADPTPTAMMEETEKPTIIFSDLDWNSAQIQNSIARRILELGYGYETEAIFGSTVPLFQALIGGDTNVTMEIWLPNQQEAWDEAKASGEVVEVGKSLEDNWQATFVIPQYVADANPGLRTVEDLQKEEYRNLFVTPDSDGKARLLNCIPGWECENVNLAKIETYGLGDSVEPFNPGSAAALAAEVEASFLREEPVLFYYWGPTTLSFKMATEFGGYYILEEPEYSDECWDAGKGCAYKVAEIYIAVRTELVEKAPDLIEFLGKWDFNAGNQLAAEGYLDETGADFPEVADWFLENTEQWKEWVAEGVAEKVIAGIKG